MSLSGHRPELDGLRGFAIALVLVTHVFGVPGAGLVGVLLFFVLSGYLITAGLLSEHRTNGRVRLMAFYWRRALRLLPGLVLFSVILFSAASVSAFGVAPDRAATGILQGILYVTDITLGLQLDYVPQSAHLWSLAVEEHFYLFWPLALIALLRLPEGRPRVRRLAGLLVVAALLRVVTVAVSTRFGLYHYVLPTTWADSMLFGAFVALSTQERHVPNLFVSRVASHTAALVGSGLVVTLYGFLPWSYRSPFTYIVGITLLAACSGLLVVGVQAKGGILCALFSSAPLRHLGLISYGVYLYNSLFILLAEHAFGDRLVVRAVAAFAALAVAGTSYWAFELPIRKVGRRLLSGDTLSAQPDPLVANLSAAFGGERGRTETS